MLGVAIAALAVAAMGAYAQTPQAVQSPTELKRLSLEELFAMEVTSVSRKPEKLSKTAAAIHVVTDEDIRRSGALSLPEALRSIPGVEVARADSRQYAITARGFNGTVANKLLVLIDGRSIYTPLFSGVFWDVQDTFMEDISRIEVIRGPGATVWGANAVNGIISVLSKSAEDTQGFLVTAGGGNEERGFGGLRYGGRLGSKGFFRVHAKYFGRDDAAFPGGTDAEDAFQMGQGGFRIDWKSATSTLLTLQGDLYDGGARQAAGDDIDLGGGNFLGRWAHTFSAESKVRVQGYFDRTDRDLPQIFRERLDTYDLDLQHLFSPGTRHEVVWGFGYRVTRDDVDNSPSLAFLPSRLTHSLITGFVQDDIELVADRLHLSLGTKSEQNDYTGWEYQPSGRLTWTPSAAHTVWTAVSRAVRTPSRIDRDFFVPGTPPFVLLAGGRNFESEVLLSYEAGYRVEPTPNLNASLAAYYNRYDELRSLEAGPPPFLANGLEGRSHGVELEATGQLRPGWRLNAGYAFIDIELRAEPGSTDTTQQLQEGDSPRHQVFVRSLMDLPHAVELDVTVRHVDELPHLEVDAYTALDLHFGWKATEDLEVSIFGRNLLDHRHPEFGAPATRREVERSVYGKVRCRF